MDTIDRENFLSFLAILQKKKKNSILEHRLVLPPNQYTNSNFHQYTYDETQISTTIYTRELSKK